MIGTLTSQHVALQMLGVQVGLVAVRAGEFAVCILCRNGVVGLRRAVDSVGHYGSPAWSAGQYTSTSLGAHHMRSC